MRPTSLALPLLAIAVLGLLVAPVALADEHGDARGKDKATEAKARHENRTSHDNDSDEDRDPKNKTRPAHVAAYLARLAEIRQSWHENATQIREDCRNATIDRENATHEDRLGYAHCIRDGYKELRVWWKAEMKAAHTDFKTDRATWKAARAAERSA